jgi:RimJ/RimL family protein N-acetyltransferase
VQPFTYPGYRVRLRPIRLDDVDAIMEWINEPEVTKNFATMSRQITREEELAFLQRTLASDTDRLYAIEDAEGRYVGNAGVHKIYWPAKNGRLGLVIGDRSLHGQGYGQEALRLLVALAFRQLALHKVWIVHFRTNERMAHLCRKLGFAVEGVLRDEYFHRDGWHDMVRCSLLQHEFEASTWAPGEQA